jgi:TPR repeat protein
VQAGPLRFTAFLAILASAPACSRVKVLKQQCLAGDTGACESACNKGVVGEGGCFQAGSAHRQKSPLDFGSPDFREARRFFKKSCDGGFGEGCLFAAQTIDAPYGPLDTAAMAAAPAAPATISDADIAERQRLLERACDLSPATACKRLGDVLVGKNASRAESAYHRACKSSTEPDACRAQRSKEVNALEQWRSGCTRGLADDCTRLGDALYAIDAPRAIRLFVSECQLRGVEGVAGGLGKFVAERAANARGAFEQSRSIGPPGSGGPQVTPLPPSVRGSIAVVAVQRALQMHAVELSSCVAALPRTTQAKVVVEGVVDLTGDVWRAKATESTLAGVETECLLSVIRDIGFGAPLTAPATVVVPLAIGGDARP